MEINFYKYQATGNDFVMIDNREGALQHSQNKLFNLICDRRFGIGADGLILLENAEGYDFGMFYANADGHPGSMCGNGGRCIAAFAKKLGICNNVASFIAVDGPHTAKISGDDVSLQMVDVAEVSHVGTNYLSLSGDRQPSEYNHSSEYNRSSEDKHSPEDKHFSSEAPPTTSFLLDTGSPHLVLLRPHISEEDVVNSGRSIRNATPFREVGVNVNFVQAEGEGYFVRTYERGVEDETLACGTGVTAVALAMAELQDLHGFHKTEIRTRGGKLSVGFERVGAGQFHSIFLEGRASFVFKGSYSISANLT